MTQPTEQVVALFNYAGTSPTDICFKKGETISILQRKSDWAEGEANGKKGWFPLSYVEQPDRSPRGRNPAEAADSIVESKAKTKAQLGEFFAARGANKSDFKTKLVEKNIIVTDPKEKEKEKDKDSATKKSSTSALKKLRRASERRKDKKEEKKDASSGSSEALLSKSPQAENYFYSKRDSEASSPAMSAPAAAPELTDKEKAKAEKEKKKKALNSFFAKRMSASRPKPRVVEEDKDKGGVCGMTLAQLASLQKDHVTEVPLVLTLLIDFIAAHGYDVEGIFRIAGNAYKVDDLSKMFASSSLSTIGGINPSTDAHVCGELLKKILRDLPEPIFTYKLHDDFIQTTNIDNREERIAKMRELYLQLPPVNAAVLKALFAMLIPVAYNSTNNLMTVENLSTVFGPTLLRRKEMDFLSGLNDRSKDVVYNLLLDYDPIINNKPNPEDHDTKLFPVVKKANVVRPEHMMAISPRAESSPSLKPSNSQEWVGGTLKHSASAESLSGALKPSASQESIGAASDKEESAKSESSSEKKDEKKDEVKPAELSPRAPLPKSSSHSDDLTELREPSGEEPK